MFKFFRFIYKMVYIDRRPSRLALKLFVGRMARMAIRPRFNLVIWKNYFHCPEIHQFIYTLLILRFFIFFLIILYLYFPIFWVLKNSKMIIRFRKKWKTNEKIHPQGIAEVSSIVFPWTFLKHKTMKSILHVLILC